MFRPATTRGPEWEFRSRTELGTRVISCGNASIKRGQKIALYSVYGIPKMTRRQGALQKRQIQLSALVSASSTFFWAGKARSLIFKFETERRYSIDHFYIPILCFLSCKTWDSPSLMGGLYRLTFSPWRIPIFSTPSKNVVWGGVRRGYKADS